MEYYSRLAAALEQVLLFSGSGSGPKTRLQKLLLGRTGSNGGGMAPPPSSTGAPSPPPPTSFPSSSQPPALTLHHHPHSMFTTMDLPK
ncbi:hypothetical protein PRIPAC_75370 [Pristionchus pacificus]|nr:hypothetical protein PRIPAC_75370 [Pristionchus pacificus]